MNSLQQFPCDSTILLVTDRQDRRCGRWKINTLHRKWFCGEYEDIAFENLADVSTR